MKTSTWILKPEEEHIIPEIQKEKRNKFLETQNMDLADWNGRNTNHNPRHVHGQWSYKNKDKKQEQEQYQEQEQEQYQEQEQEQVQGQEHRNKQVLIWWRRQYTVQWR